MAALGNEHDEQNEPEPILISPLTPLEDIELIIMRDGPTLEIMVELMQRVELIEKKSRQCYQEKEYIQNIINRIAGVGRR